jgi:hypothetical protein
MLQGHGLLANKLLIFSNLSPCRESSRVLLDSFGIWGKRGKQGKEGEERDTSKFSVCLSLSLALFLRQGLAT